MVNRLVHELSRDGFPVTVASRVLKVSTSGFYERRSRGPSVRDLDDALLIDAIRDSVLAGFLVLVDTAFGCAMANLVSPVASRRGCRQCSCPDRKGDRRRAREPCRPD